MIGSLSLSLLYSRDISLSSASSWGSILGFSNGYVIVASTSTDSGTGTISQFSSSASLPSLNQTALLEQVSAEYLAMSSEYLIVSNASTNLLVYQISLSGLCVLPVFSTTQCELSTGNLYLVSELTSSSVISSLSIDNMTLVVGTSYKNDFGILSSDAYLYTLPSSAGRRVYLIQLDASSTVT